MKRRTAMRGWIGAACALLAGTAWGASAGTGTEAATAASPAAGAVPEVRVMTFNVRYGAAKDGENHWDRRKDLLLETVRAFDPDLLGTQEALDFQRDFLAAGLPGHGVMGVGRDDGGEKGEMMALFYRKDRFEKLDGGHFWLSETPDRPGSKSWDSSLPRMATWVKLRDRRAPDAPPVLHINTHFDHIGTEARLQAARLLRARAASMGGGCRVIVTGDFNAGEGSAPYKAFFDRVDGADAPLVDAFRIAHPKPGPAEGTISRFRPEANDGPRIDWIGVSRGWKVVDVTIVRAGRDGHTPSDHFPVTAVLRTEKE